MSLMKIKDNAAQKKQLFEKIPGITEKIADKTLEQLEKDGLFIFPEFQKDTEDLTKGQMILRSVNDAYYTGNVMGFLSCGKERLTITSRFASEENDFFLYYMLEKVVDYPNVFDMEVDTDPSKNILDILSFLFPRYLQEAMRKGLFKTYRRVSYNDSNPRGTIDIARHINKNIPFLGKIAYSQRQYSCDNYLIQLIRHTIEYIRMKPHGDKLLRLVKDEVDKVVKATPSYQVYDRKKILTENKKHIIQHAYFYEYRALQRLCILILQNRRQAVGVEDNRVYGVLFDGAWLWEEYVASLVSEWFHHPKNKAGKGAQQLFFNETRKTGLIYPDFIGKDTKNRFIADAKYKPINNIGRDDYFQVLAYMFRFDGKKGIYFYPETENTPDLRLWLNQGSTFESGGVSKRDDLCLIKHGLKLPQQADSYRDFSEKMKLAEAEFRQILVALSEESWLP